MHLSRDLTVLMFPGIFRFGRSLLSLAGSTTVLRMFISHARHISVAMYLFLALGFLSG